MATHEALLTVGRIMGSYSCIAQVKFEGTYGMEYGLYIGYAFLMFS